MMIRMKKFHAERGGAPIAAGVLCTALLAAASTACAGRWVPGAGFDRPAPLVGEWVDVHKSTAADTSLWVLRADGYDGSAHLIASTAQNGATRFERRQSRYGSWYLSGSLADAAQRQLCFARRLGRTGATCVHFSLDTVAASGQRRLVLQDYQGEHHTGERELLARQP